MCAVKVNGRKLCAVILRKYTNNIKFSIPYKSKLILKEDLFCITYLLNTIIR